jgi:hypothetical protein
MRTEDGALSQDVAGGTCGKPVDDEYIENTIDSKILQASLTDLDMHGCRVDGLF